MVEQNALQALSIATRGYILVDGRNSRTGAASDAGRRSRGAAHLPRRVSGPAEIPRGASVKTEPPSTSGDDRGRAARDHRASAPARPQEGHRRARRALQELHRPLAVRPDVDVERGRPLRRLAQGRRCRASSSSSTTRRLVIPDRPGNQRLDGMTQPGGEPAHRPDLPDPGHGGDAAGERPRVDRARRASLLDRVVVNGKRPAARHRRGGRGGLHPLRQGVQALRPLGARAWPGRERARRRPPRSSTTTFDRRASPSTRWSARSRKGTGRGSTERRRRTRREHRWRRDSRDARCS